MMAMPQVLLLLRVAVATGGRIEMCRSLAVLLLLIVPAEKTSPPPRPLLAAAAGAGADGAGAGLAGGGGGGGEEVIRRNPFLRRGLPLHTGLSLPFLTFLLFFL